MISRCRKSSIFNFDLSGSENKLFMATGITGKSETNKGKNWFDFFDYLASNWMLPLGGLFIALFVAWRIDPETRAHAYKSGSRWHFLYVGWLQLLRYLVPVAVLVVFLHLIGVI